MTAAIELKNVTKTFGRGRKRVEALRGVSMTVEPGEIFGLLGPNGAGKSTLVKILMTVISPSNAEGSVLGSKLGDRNTLGRIGYLPEHHKFPDYLTASQVMHHFGAMSGVGRGERKKRTGELLDLVGIGGWSKDKVGKFSKGMRQRLGIAQALVNDPDLVLLDEPTDGVDPVGRREIRAVVEELRRRGKAVLLNSHLLSELELVCDRVAILVKGRVAQEGRLDELGAEDRHYEVILSDAPPPELLTRFDFVNATGSMLNCSTTDAAKIQPLLASLIEAGSTVTSVRPVRPTLEDLFMAAVTDPETGQTLAPGADRAKRAKKGAES